MDEASTIAAGMFRQTMLQAIGHQLGIARPSQLMIQQLLQLNDRRRQERDAGCLVRPVRDLRQHLGLGRIVVGLVAAMMMVPPLWRTEWQLAEHPALDPRQTACITICSSCSRCSRRASS